MGISPEGRKLFWKYLAKYQRPASPELRKVFLKVRGWPFTINGVEQVPQQIKEQASIERVRVSAHTFRYTFARRFLERGGDVYKLSQLMGQADVKTIEKYRE